MATAIVILAIWTVLSLPISVFLGACLKHDGPRELVGMDGSFAVYRHADGSIERISLFESAST